MSVSNSNADEYIKRSVAIQCARDVANDFRNEGFVEEAGAADTVGDWLQDFPAADVRPVVLCRDCKHSEQWYADKSRCFLWHESGIDVFNDGFCNYGVKREKS